MSGAVYLRQIAPAIHTKNRSGEQQKTLTKKGESVWSLFMV